MLSLELIYTAGFQRVATGWLCLFSLLYLLFAVFAPLLGVHIVFIQIITILHLVCFLGVAMLCSLPYYFTASPSDRYIRTHHPWGRASSNSFALFDFLRGRYDDGSDENLALIKWRYRRLILLQLWAFGLCFTPYPIWLISALAVALITP